jgi:hypothetical protein
VAGALSDQAWKAICAAAGHAGTRERLATILFEEYPAFHYDRKRVATDLKRSEHMLKHLDAFAELYRQTFLPQLPADHLFIKIKIKNKRTGRWTEKPMAQPILTGGASVLASDVRTVRDFGSIAGLWQRAEAVWLTARAIRRAHRGHRNVQQEWLYNQLCAVWLWDFHANELTYSVPSWGGPPYGPLIAFMLAAIRQVVSEEELPSPYALRDAILRERDERERARQLGLFLQERRPLQNAILTLEK